MHQSAPGLVRLANEQSRAATVKGHAALFFDSRDGDEFFRDEDGLELAGIEAAREEATAGLADFAKDAVLKAGRREMAIEVRDESERQLLRASLWFEVQLVPM